MKRDYLTLNYGSSKSKSLRKGFLALLLFFSFAYSYAQEDITIITTSDDANWSINFTNSGGAALTWLASGPGLPADIPGTGNNPSFDFSPNAANQPITVTISSSDNFDFVTVLLAPGREIESVDLANMENVQILEMPSNDLTAIDVSTNTALTRLNLNNNSLASIDLSTNVNLEEFDASFNDLTTADVAGIPNLEFIDISSNQLTTIDLSGNNQLSLINLEFNLLDTGAIGQVITDVEAYGTGGFGHILNLTGNPGDIPASSIGALNNLLARGWIVRPPVIYDFGDAPDSYATTNANGGPQHIIGDGDLNLGTVYDDEFDGFPGSNADGDDTDKVADEDGVDPNDLLGIATSTDNFSVDVDYTNNTSSPSNIYAWIDFDRSGSFDADEFATAPIGNGGSGTVTLTWANLIANGVDIVEGDSYARFRTTSDILTATDVGGIVNNGEVEDYFLVIQLDTDRDGVPDVSDLDADNDGILNTDEPGDTNGNGIDDSLELDADGDGCFDTLEAGVLDGDGDGYVGTGILTSANVDADGLVISDDNGPINAPVDAYGPLNDLNNNTILDSQEAGAAANITTQPVDQDLIIGDVTFTVVTDLAPGDESYQWEESTDGGANWNPIVDTPGEYAGATTASLVVTNTDVSRLTDRYRVLVSNIAYACDPVTTSDEVTYITPDDFDLDTVFDIVDEDDDNDGISDIDEDNGVVDRDTDGDGSPDRIDLDSDNDGCFDVDENLYDNNGINQVGDQNPAVVDLTTGLVTSLGPNGGYGVPVDANGNGTPDFQEAGAAANITTQPVDQDLIIGDVTFTAATDLAPGDESYQWEESIDGGANWNPIVDTPGEYAGATTTSLIVTNTDVSRLTDRYRLVARNIAFACDLGAISDEVTYITPDDFDLDTVFDIVDEDDDNDGISDIDEDNGVVDRDTDGDGNPDRIDLDSDNDGCFDVDENLYDNNGINQVGNQNPAVVDLTTGLVTSLGANGGYGVPVDADGNGTPDFQEAGAAATITTQPTDQDLVIGTTTFSVVATADTYQWQEDRQDGSGFVNVVDGGDYSGATTADLMIANVDFTKVRYQYQVIVNNVAYACDPTTTSVVVTFINPDDFDKDGVFDLVDEDDDNDGLLDITEDNGVVDRDTDGDGFPDRIDLDSDNDGCFDVDENLYDNNGINEVGSQNPPVVDAVTGIVTSLGPNGGYGVPVDQDGNGTPDFQEAGAAATITTQPVDQNLIIGVVTFSVVATADTYQWEESIDGGANWNPLVDGGDYAGATTADLMVTNSDVSKINYRYRVLVNNIAYACDPVTVSAEARYIAPTDFDNDGVFDILDVDDDNDGILDIDVAGNSEPGTHPDATNLDADSDGCFDVTEAGFTDNGMGMLGTSNPPVVDATGRVTSAADGYTPPNDLDNNGVADFQEAGAAATITTQPVDQNFLPGGTVTFDVVATADTYQWEESTDGSTWTAVVDGGDYSGAMTASLTIANIDVSMLGYQYRVMVNNIAYACDPVTTSDSAALVSLPDNDNDLVPDVVDVDDDNDGILDTVEDNGVVDRDTDGNGIPDRFELDSDGDGCYDVTEAGFTDNGMGMLGTANPPVVDVNGQVTSATDGYTTPNDLDNNGTPDFQEAGTVANITADPVDQDFILGGDITFTAASDGDTYQWEVSSDGVNFTPLSDDTKYTGTTTESLTVLALEIPDYFNEYRVVARNIGFACDPGDTSGSASYNILIDTDNDGVFDIVDADDDNDGIDDTVEGEVTDTNLDGRPDRISLDSDSDGCADTVEAGFTDPDGDGILGTSPVTVDVEGRVTGQGGYTTPNDLDNNGVFDFQEAGEPSSIENQPEEVEVALGDDAVFEVSATATFYQWQQSMNGGGNWVDLVNDAQFSGVNTDRLVISDARGRLEGSWYRVVLTSPDFACDPVTELISDGARLVFNTELIPSGFSPNGDSINEEFFIPGLIETPDFSMEVFDRWGNSVYKYANNGSLNPDWWDGRSTGNMTLSKGELVPAGTYFYLIEYNDGNKSPDKGWVYVNY